MKKTYLVVLEVTDDCDPQPLTKQEVVDAVIDGGRAARPAGVSIELVSIQELLA